MKPPVFYHISPRVAAHGVRSTLLALRLSAMQRCPAPNSNYYHPRKCEIEAVRWLDLHCHLNAITPCRSPRYVFAKR